METENRILAIIPLELTSKLLKLEEQVEVAINSDLDVNIKVKQIIDLLGEITTTEKSLEKFNLMVNNNIVSDK